MFKVIIDLKFILSIPSYYVKICSFNFCAFSEYEIMHLLQHSFEKIKGDLPEIIKAISPCSNLLFGSVWVRGTNVF